MGKKRKRKKVMSDLIGTLNDLFVCGEKSHFGHKPDLGLASVVAKHMLVSGFFLFFSFLKGRQNL